MKKYFKVIAFALASLMMFSAVGCKKNIEYQSFYSYYDEEVPNAQKGEDKGDGASQTESSKDNTGTSSKPVSGIVTDKDDIVISDNKGIESKVAKSLAGKTLKMACFNTIKYQSAAFQRTVKAFEAKYDCKVDISYFAFGEEYNNAVRNSIAAKKPYDIAFMHGSWLYDVIAANVYEPLNNSISKEDLLDSNKKGIDLDKSSMLSWNGKIYGVCGYDAVNPMLIFYNKSKFEQAGLEDPRTLYEKGQWTWDKFFDMGSQVVDASNDVWFGEYNFFRVEICATFGGSPFEFSDDGTPYVTIDSDKYIAGLNNIAKLGSGATKIIRTQNQEDQLENFKAGKTYVYTEESDRYISIMEDISKLSAFKRNGENLGVVPLPLGNTNTEKAYPTGWLEAACTPKGANTDYAVAWMQFASTYEDPVTTDQTMFSKEDQAMIDSLLENIIPRLNAFSDSSWSMGSLEWNLCTEAARGNDIAQYVAQYKPQMQSCIDATLSNLSKIK